MTVRGLTVDRADGDVTMYRPVVATVTGFSKYNEAQFSLSGIDGFWVMTPTLLKTMSVPTQGQQAMWTCRTKLKTPGPNTKPGAMYHDIVAVGKVSPEAQAEHDARQPQPVEDIPWTVEGEPLPQDGTDRPAGAIGPNDPVPAKYSMPRAYFEAQERITRRSIEAQVAAKLMGELACAALNALSAQGGGLGEQAFALVQRAREMAEVLWEGEQTGPVDA